MGWIKLDRKVCDNWVWRDKPFTKGQAWVDLLLLADYEDNDGYYRNSVKHFKAGVVYRSISCLAVRWGWSRDKVRRFLNVLQDENMILLKATKNDTTITLVKWAFYQHGNTSDNTTDNTTGKSSDKSSDNTTDNTYTRNKEDKEEKEYCSSDEPEEDDEFFASWIINDEGYKEFIDMKQVETEEGFIYFDRAGRKYITDWDKGYRLADE